MFSFRGNIEIFSTKSRNEERSTMIDNSHIDDKDDGNDKINDKSTNNQNMQDDFFNINDEKFLNDFNNIFQ